MAKPQLDENQIQRLATPGSYERGEEYYQQSKVISPTQKGSILSAYCSGNRLYQMAVVLGEEGITRHSCTCPYNRGGLCKHRVALLLTWLRQPELFQVLPTLKANLQNRSKGEIIELVEMMVEREPMLLPMVDRSLVLPSSFVTAAYQLPTSPAIIETLQPVLENAKVLLTSGYTLNAGLLYQLLLAELTQNYDAERQGIDYNSELCRFSVELVVGLGQCLQDKYVPELLQSSWYQTLAEAYCKELECRGIGYAEGVDQILCSATIIHWEIIITQLARCAEQSVWTETKLKQLIQQREKLIKTHVASLEAEPNNFDDIFQKECEKIEKYINQRSRRSYRKAISYLKELKSTSISYQQESAWNNYLGRLRYRYGRLKSLWQEFDDSGL